MYGKVKYVWAIFHEFLNFEINGSPQSETLYKIGVGCVIVYPLSVASIPLQPLS
jgi:hypothetical protein